jgi:predicted DNA-binding transcriptional regulator AlpA
MSCRKSEHIGKFSAGGSTRSACLTMSLAEAAKVIGVHRTTAWSIYKRGEFPVPVLKVGSSLRVVRSQLEAFLISGEPVKRVHDVIGASDPNASLS